MELSIFDVARLFARTWRTESNHVYLEITVVSTTGVREIINLVGPDEGIAFSTAAQGINEAFQ